MYIYIYIYINIFTRSYTEVMWMPMNKPTNRYVLIFWVPTTATLVQQ